jgi:hypothetical protein
MQILRTVALDAAINLGFRPFSNSQAWNVLLKVPVYHFAFFPRSGDATCVPD